MTSTPAVTGRGAWRSPLLGEPRDLGLSGGTLRCFERGTGEPLVFLHGVLTNANVWRGVVDRLAKDFRCLVLDLPLGAHTVPMPGADLSLRGLGAVVAEAVDALGIAPAAVVANDTGGAVAQMVAAYHGDHVSRLVLTSCEFRDNCPPLLFKVMGPLARVPGGLVAYLAPGQIRPLQRLPVAYGWLAKSGFQAEVGDSYTLPSIVSRPIRRDFATFLRHYGKSDTLAAAERLPRFSAPTLVAWSRQDRVMPPAHGEQLARLIPGARLEWVEDSYTLSPEDQPERLATLIGAFAVAGSDGRRVTAGSAGS